MADEDNFDIDIYGDGEGMDEDSKLFYKQENQKSIAMKEQQETEQQNSKRSQMTVKTGESQVQSAKSDSGTVTEENHARSKPQQGTKRKGDSDERHIDAGATNALMISDLHWWTTEDDIRGWINDAGVENELRDLTFSEHKVNGKSKGQVFLEFMSPQASTATKRKIEILANSTANSRKFAVIFTNAASNPFKTLPKDAPMRAKDDRPQRSTSTTYSTQNHQNNYNNGNNFRGGRGGFGGRGNYSQNYNNNNNNNSNNGGNNNNNNSRSFSGPASNMGGFGSGPGFQGNMPMMNNFGNFGVRGGMMGNNMRGNMHGIRGRGGMNNMMPMGMGMGMGMVMNPMMAGMGSQGFGGTGPQFNPGMFPQNGNPGMNGGDWAHGAKRQRHD